MMANYAYTDGKVTKDTDPNKVGIATPGSTKHIANAWLTYRFRDSSFKGLGISLGTQYQAGRTAWYVFDGTSQLLPDYFRLDAAISYQAHRFLIALNINNITNRYLIPGILLIWRFYYWQSVPKMISPKY